jgi:cytochrome c-type biogenesis protein CcmH
MIWIVFALMTGAAVMAVLAPLASRRGQKDDKTADIAFFEAQIAEIDRDRHDGRLDPADAEAARAEAARRLLRANAGPQIQASVSRKATLIAALVAIALVPTLALSLYFKLGSADLPDMPLTARLDAQPERVDLAGAVARIEQHLREQPDDGRGWEVVAPYFLRTGRGEDAIHAYAEALRLLGPTAERRAALGEARMIVADGKATPAAVKDFEAATALDPANIMARYYLAVAAAQAGEKEKAIEQFERLAADAPPDAGWLNAVKAQLATLRGIAASSPTPSSESSPPEARSGPDSEQGRAIAAMPAQERAGMIRTMVERLATRLQANGDDVEGWLKLIRAYSVLAETDKLKQAIADAHKALAAKQDDNARIDALARELGVGG